MSSGEEIYRMVEEICSFGWRWAGTPEAERAERYIYGKLKDAGLDEVELEEFTFTRWWPEKYGLTLLREGAATWLPSEVELNVFPVWFSGATPPEGVTAELVYAGFGTQADFDEVDVDGKIALIDGRMILNFYPTWEIFGSDRLAAERGAVGLVAINGSPLDSAAYLFYIQGVEGWRERIPMLSISNDDGELLRSLCKRGKVTVRLVEDAREGEATSRTVIGVLHGESEETILVGTHTDSTFTGAIDNAGANAGLIALARHYARVPKRDRGKTMVFAGWTGHEAAFLGVNKFVEMHEDLLSNVVTFIMLDGFASKGYYNQAEWGVVETGEDEKRGLFVSENPVLLPVVVEAALKYGLTPSAYVPARRLPVSDLGPFIERNIPSIMVIGKPVWYHTKYDTVDRCTPEQLERALKAHIHIIDAIHRIPGEEIKNADGKLERGDEIKVRREGEVKGGGGSLFFTVTPSLPVEGVPAIFHLTIFTTGGEVILDLAWDFGDGAEARLPIGVHSYEKPGVYEVKATAKDTGGNVYVAKRKITVLPRKKGGAGLPSRGETG